MNKFYTLDIESRGYLGRFLLAGLYDGKRYFEFKKVEDLVKKLFKIKGIVFCHFLDYDFRFLFDYFQRKKIKINHLPLVYKGKVIEWRIHDNLILRDSFVLLQNSLKDLAESFGLERKKIILEDYQELKINKKLKDYLKNDVLILYEILKKLYDFIGYKYINKKTLSSIVLEIFKEKFTKDYEKIIGSEILKEEEDFIRKAYYGVYVHTFKRVINGKKEKILKIDNNSFYGAMMRDHVFPYGKTIKVNGHQKIQEMIKRGFLGIVEGEAICHKKLPLGILGVREKDRTLFNVFGKKIKGVWTSTDIEFAQEKGYKVKMKKGIFWLKKDYLFKKIINFLAKIKEKESGAKRQIAKMMMVSFYGKFGQKRNIEIISFNHEENKPKKLYLDKEMNFIEEEKYLRLLYSHPEISAFTTSYARIFLWKTCEKLGWSSVYSVLADSLIIKEPKNRDFYMMIDQKKTGKFRIIGEVKEGVFLGYNIYALKLKNGQEIIKNQGGIKEYTKNLTYEDYKRAFKKKIWKQYEDYPKAITLKESLKKNLKIKFLKNISRTLYLTK